MNTSISDRMNALKSHAISTEEADQRDLSATLLEQDAKTKFKPGENHLQAFYRVNQERIKQLAFLANQKGGYNSK